MKNKKLLLAAAVAAFIFCPASHACTNILVTKGATKDGSNIISYSADSHMLFGYLHYIPAGRWAEGDSLQIVNFFFGRHRGAIPQVPQTYQTVGNINDHQLLFGETTFGGREELMDRSAMLDYDSLISIALQRCTTVREAIPLMAELAAQYGYASSGESFSIADKEEVWIMELISKGVEMVDGVNVRKGIVYVARRVPDGYICSHANQARITTFPLDDPENCLYSPDVISFAREMGYYDGPDEEFSFADAYCPLDFSGMRRCDARAWSAFNILCDGEFTFEDENGDLVTKNSYDYLDYAMGHNKENRLPLFVKPSRKLGVKDVADAMRDHYEGTPMDMTADIGAGGNGLPYRWRPMEWEYEGKHYTNERPIATQQTGFWFVGQTRSSLPDEIGGLLWFGTDDAATSYLTPIYSTTQVIPECFRQGNGSMFEYSPTCSFWLNNRVANACYKMYNIMAPYVRNEIDNWENHQMENVTKIDSTALALYNKALENPSNEEEPFAEVKNYLTEFSVNTAQEIFKKWTDLEITLLLKFVDGNIKDLNFGDFQSPENVSPEGRPRRMPIEDAGYTDKWKEMVVKDHGDVAEFEPETTERH
ncbi:MAG: C69 family dipeptidase [Bacteroidales bacterium]|nr:C69 family dipeptidase [Bacteroidales bacterium]